jgi:cell division protein FtsN
MSRNSNSRSAPPRKGNPLFAGILVGMVVGLAIAGGVAWYILKGPSPFVSNAQHEAVKLAPEPAKPAPAPAVKTAPSSAGVEAASGVGEGKPRFEFYKVLTDKQDTTPMPAEKGSGKPGQKAQSGAKEVYYLQAGSFPSAEDADKMKARLSMLGMDVSVQTATIPDKGTWHRVRLGPYKGADEMNKVSAMLKQNGVNATPILAQ